MAPNLEHVFDSTVIKNINVNRPSVDSQVKSILASNPICSIENLNTWLLKAVSVIDLTTLAGDDTRSNVIRLCLKAANPLSPKVMYALNIAEGTIRTGAVCVYPSRVADAYNTLKRMGLENEINVASVATGFPSGQIPFPVRLTEIKHAVEYGASEIDVVLDRSLVLTGKWQDLYKEVMLMKQECGKAHLKVILGVGELGSYENVYKASMVSMLAGADFIKTSTGKEAVNATLPVGLVMCRAIRNFYQITGVKVGLKPAGGLKTAQDAINWLVLVHSELGPEWLNPKLFRIGASSLLDVIDQQLALNTAEMEKTNESSELLQTLSSFTLSK